MLSLHPTDRNRVHTLITIILSYQVSLNSPDLIGNYYHSEFVKSMKEQKSERGDEGEREKERERDEKSEFGLTIGM